MSIYAASWLTPNYRLASIWKMNPDWTFLRTLDPQAPAFTNSASSPAVSGGYAALKSLLEDGIFSVTATGISSQDIWTPVDGGQNFTSELGIGIDVTLQDSDLGKLRTMQDLLLLTGHATIIPAFIVNGLNSRRDIIHLSEDQFVQAVTAVLDAPVSDDLAHAIYQEVSQDLESNAHKKARQQDLMDPANPASLVSLDPNAPPEPFPPKHATVNRLVGG